MGYEPEGRSLDQDIRSRSRRCGITRAIVMSLLLGLVPLGIGVDGWTADDDSSRLMIISPVQGAIIKGDSIKVQYKLPKGVHATHVHCYVDGEYQRGFKGVLEGLARGPHEIKIVAANHDHSGLGAEAVVTIEVE